MKPVLLVDDEAKLRKILHSSLAKMGYPVFTAANGKEAREFVRDKAADIVLLDMMLPDTTGLELLHELVPLYPQKAFIVMTAYGNVESAVLSMKSGAFDYITKPAKLEEIVIALQRASEWIDMKQENVRLKQKLSFSDRSRELIGVSPAMQRIFQLAERVAGTDATVLLEGESGTGKSRIARMIHDLSERSQAPFVAVNCAAIPEQLLESELFGYEKGAFTGAAAARSGKFEAAHGGTIFLDESARFLPRCRPSCCR
nr:sigma-54 dependent transcriptional regulator [Paenibacillus sp. VKM B-2647]